LAEAIEFFSKEPKEVETAGEIEETS